MAKAYYDVSYKTYYNDRLKPVLFRGKESHPLYLRVTYDRETTSFRSYYFDLFRQEKYDLQGPTLAQIDELEGRVIDYIIARNTNRFSLDLVLYEYRLYSADLLDNFERSFLLWLAGCLRAERLPHLAYGGCSRKRKRCWPFSSGTTSEGESAAGYCQPDREKRRSGKCTPIIYWRRMSGISIRRDRFACPITNGISRKTISRCTSSALEEFFDRNSWRVDTPRWISWIARMSTQYNVQGYR